MATLTATSVTGTGEVTATINTLTSSDTFTYNPGSGQILSVLNDTGSEVTLNIDGDGQDSTLVAGIGSVDVSGGLDIVIANGAEKLVRLDTIKHYLQGTIAMSGASGAKAKLLEF